MPAFLILMLTMWGHPNICNDLVIFGSGSKMDVPAIQVEKIVGHNQWCDSDTVDGNGKIIAKGKWCHADPITEQTWTCKSKRRVLLTDESGSKHCVLFSREVK